MAGSPMAGQAVAGDRAPAEQVETRPAREHLPAPAVALKRRSVLESERIGTQWPV